MHYDPNMLQTKSSDEVCVAASETQTSPSKSEIEAEKVTLTLTGDASMRSIDGPRFQPFYACSVAWSLMLEPDANIAVSEVQVKEQNAGTVLTLESRTGQDLAVDVDIDTHVATFSVAKTAQPYKKWIIRLAPGIGKEWTSKPTTLKIQAPTPEQQIISFEREVPQCDLKFFSTTASTQQSRREIDGLPQTEF
jgi:hypothetical protein